MHNVMLGTLGLGAIGLMGSLTEMPLLTTGSTAAMAVMQLWTISQLNPIKERLAEITTQLAVMEQRCDDALGCRRGKRLE